MEKFLKIGEQYVQWIALGLGVLFLGLMAYSYVLTPPITVALEKKDYLPGEIDQQIRNGALRRIEDDMKSTTKWADPTPSNPAKALQVAFVDKAPLYVKTIPAPTDIRVPTTNHIEPTATPTIVKAPAAQPSPVGPVAGTSVLNVPQAVPAPPANAAAGPAAAAGGVPVQPVLEPQDHDWISLPWTVDMKALDDAFQAANIPNIPNVYQTTFLRVKMVRQEVLPNGKYGPEQELPDIPTVALDPMPPETAPAQDKDNYRTWAAAHAGDILTPAFFSVSYGTPWYAPGTPKPTDVFPPPGAALPAAPLLPQPVLPARTPGAGLAPPHSVHGPAMPAPAIAPGALPPRGLIGQPNQPAVAPAMPPNVFAPGVAPGGFPPGVVQGAAVAGFINPAQAPDVTIYTHDWSVQAGHSYRYKICYTISNPLFGVEQANVKPADRDLLAIKSPYSKWTAAVDIPSRYKFWVQKFQRNGNNEVTFDLFIKKPGAPGGLERNTVRATPGDSIGPSPWLLVDVRQDPAKRNFYYFLIADSTGHIERHEVEKDTKDPDHLEMLDRTGASAAAIGG
jgi:hypothetical protein